MPALQRFNGIKLREFRKERRWSLEELSRRSGLSVSHLSALEKGERKSPSVELVYQLAEALSISIYQLLNTDDIQAYPNSSDQKDMLVAEDFVRWGRRLHPEMITFIQSQEAEEYLNLAYQLYENRNSSSKLLQLITQFVQRLNEHSLS